MRKNVGAQLRLSLFTDDDLIFNLFVKSKTRVESASKQKFR